VCELLQPREEGDPRRGEERASSRRLDAVTKGERRRGNYYREVKKRNHFAVVSLATKSISRLKKGTFLLEKEKGKALPREAESGSNRARIASAQERGTSLFG